MKVSKLNAKYLSIQSIAAAVSIAVVFTGVGYWFGTHTVSEQINSKLPAQLWEGTWDTNTETYKNLRLSLFQNDKSVAGSYNHPSHGKTEIKGRIEGNVEGYSMHGKWFESRDGDTIEGFIHFIMLPNGESFLGSYTRSWEKNAQLHVWAGHRIER